MKCICEQCGNEFDGRTNKGVASKYCSRDCWYKAHVSKKPTLVCKNCGKEFVPKHHSKNEIRKDHIVKYCSRKCQNEGRHKKIKRVCKVCGKKFILRPCDLRKGTGEYCSYKCSNSVWIGRTDLIGPKNPNYIDGKIREYCEKWTPNLRRRVRAFFNNTCMVCGITQEEYNVKLGKQKLLHVHHVNYNKNQCCDEDVPRLLVPLCASCHTKTTVKREIWEPILTKLIMNNYGGKCFYTKEEYKQLLLEEKILNIVTDYPIVTGGENLV